MLSEDFDPDRIADDVAEVILQRITPQLMAIESAIEQLRDARNDNRKLSLKELAKDLNTSISTVRRMVASGGLPHFRVGREIRFSLPVVLESLKEQGKCPPNKKKGQRGSRKAPRPKT